ncbi:HNH endonuclease signature motif containing protein [Aquipuribacter hungaricus]|uniref:DUF222 domain-containing protein n=1 Tax=Aquipuribacter hungaricus TaxID=545624 RepID=A0ABV7WC01_9MICO
MSSGELAAHVLALTGVLTDLQGSLAPEQVWHASDDEVLQACRDIAAQRARADAAYLSLVAEVDRRRAASGARTGTGGGTSLGSTTEGLLRSAALLSAGQARRDVAAAHALHGHSTDRGTTEPPVLPVLASQLADGSITREHVDVAVRCLDRIPRHLRGTPGDASPVTSEQLGATVRDVVVTLVSEVAGTGTARDLDRACRAVLDHLDPDGGDRYDPVAYERRYLDMSTDSTGMLLGRFQLDAAAGLALRAAVDAHSAPSPTVDGLRDPRSARQRRADALVLVAEAARGTSAPVRGEPPRVVVHVTPEQLAGGASTWAGSAWSESGETVGRASARRLSCDAVLHRVVVPPAAGPLELGREERLASRTQRRALASRDRGCVVPGCGAPPAACDAHHLVHWADGGSTDLDNLVLLCGSHHTAVHAGVWAVAVCADGIPEVIPPRWVDPEQRPRRLAHHLVAAVARAAATATAASGRPATADAADHASPDEPTASASGRPRLTLVHPLLDLYAHPAPPSAPAGAVELHLTRLLDTG